jgi:hypothetical protein
LDICLKKSDDEPYSDDALLLVTPHICRLGSLTASGSVDIMSDLVRHFSHPTPLLRKLKIELKFHLGHTSAIPTTIFNGDFSSLHELSLAGVAELPRRNLSNLKVFELYCGVRVNAPSITHLLDFFESAPLLSNIKLRLSIPISNAPSGRVVSVPHLKKLTIHSRSAHSDLLKHLSIPTGASLILSFLLNGRASPVPDDLPKNLDNLSNLSHTTSISLFLDPKGNRARFNGPSGQLHLADVGTPYSIRCRIFRSLERLNLSNTRRLAVTKYIHSPAKKVGESPIFQTLLFMNHLRTLTLVECDNLPFICALNPEKDNSGTLACPNLEELILYIKEPDWFYIFELKEMASGRTRRYAKRPALTIISLGKTLPVEVFTLNGYFPCIEYKVDVESPVWGALPGDGDPSDSGRGW